MFPPKFYPKAEEKKAGFKHPAAPRRSDSDSGEGGGVLNIWHLQLVNLVSGVGTSSGEGGGVKGEVPTCDQ